MEISIRIEATGPVASGKTYELVKVAELLASRGYKVIRTYAVSDGPNAPLAERLELSREGIWHDKGSEAA